MADEPITTFVVTDIEADGPSPLGSSMLSFASVACDVTGRVLEEFEAVLEPRSDRQPHPDTMAWWQTQPDAWAHATSNAEKPEIVMPRYADWVEALPGFRVFAAAPMIFDGLWMDHYLETYAGTRVFGGPLKSARQIFRGGGVCLYTMAGTLRGAEYLKWGMQRVPADWYGNIQHTHRAIDDARGFANVLGRLADYGVKIPHDMSFISFDDTPLGAMLTPALTAVRQPIEALGRAGFQALFATMNGEAAPRLTRLPVELMERDSVRIPRSREKLI